MTKFNVNNFVTSTFSNLTFTIENNIQSVIPNNFLAYPRLWICLRLTKRNPYKPDQILYQLECSPYFLNIWFCYPSRRELFMRVILGLTKVCIRWLKACNVFPFPLPDYLQSEEQVEDIEGEGLLGVSMERRNCLYPNSVLCSG